MPSIHHKVAIQAEPAVVYQALTNIDELSQWWTRTTTGESTVGETITFRFGEHATGVKVESLEPSEKVVWQCVDSTADWIGTRMSFELKDVDDKTVLHFGHLGWQEGGEFFAHCSMKWATFLLSLKSLVETGQGRPFPDDVAI